MKLRTDCHPEARGRRPQNGDVCWRVKFMLESGETCEIEMGRKTRDILFGMMIADCRDSGEEEPR